MVNKKNDVNMQSNRPKRFDQININKYEKDKEEFGTRTVLLEAGRMMRLALTELSRMSDWAIWGFAFTFLCLVWKAKAREFAVGPTYEAYCLASEENGERKHPKAYLLWNIAKLLSRPNYTVPPVWVGKDGLETARETGLRFVEEIFSNRRGAIKENAKAWMRQLVEAEILSKEEIEAYWRQLLAEEATKKATAEKEEVERKTREETAKAERLEAEKKKAREDQEKAKKAKEDKKKARTEKKDEIKAERKPSTRKGGRKAEAKEAIEASKEDAVEAVEEEEVIPDDENIEDNRDAQEETEE